MSNFTIKDMLAMQQALQEKYKDKWEAISPEAGKHKLLWMLGEVGEVIDIIKKNGDQKSVEDVDLRQHLVEEMADVLMYYNDVLLCYGISEQELKEAYIAKFEKNMKRQIENLISNMVEKEKSIQKMEFEKLLYQINPHFLLNTLNSIQWMAQMSHQREISEFVQRLKKLLSYNLGKEGRQTTLRMELEIVKEYIALQQMRYDFIIEMNIEDGSYLDQPTVRMLFQPLVENAIRYGLGDDEKISIQVFEDVARHLAVVTISDSGKGLNQEEIDEINQPFDYDWGYWKNENRGIGLRYVKAMLESFYDGQTSLFVNSKKGFGTRITILLPVREPEEKKEKDKEVTLEENKVGQTDESIDCR